jgi:hypothetical protein
LAKKGCVAVRFLADFIVAAPEDALEYGRLIREGRPISPDRFQRAEYKDFTQLALGMLWAILRHEKWDVKRHRLEDVWHADNGEGWLFRFPDELTELIGALDEAAINADAHAWVGREVPGDADELKPVLRDLKELAIQARQRGRGLYLWGSL